MNFYQLVCRIESVLARITLFSMVILIFSSVIARTIGYPINWSIDFSTFLFAWSCFLSADVAWRENKLMSVDLLVNRFPIKVRNYIQLFNYSILILFLAYFVVFGIFLSITTWDRAFQGIPGFSYTWVTLSIPVSGIMLLITTILKFKDLIIKMKNINEDKRVIKEEIK